MKVTPLLERFRENPRDTRHVVRIELGFYDDVAAEMFALVVFVSDGLLQATQVLLHRQPTTTRASNGAVLPSGWLREGDYPWQRRRNGFQGAGKEILNGRTSPEFTNRMGSRPSSLFMTYVSFL